MKKIVVIVAAGTGSRMDSKTPKQFLLLNNKPLLWHSINAFTQCYKEIEVIVVLAEQYLAQGNKIIQAFEKNFKIQTAIGGPTRFHSVKNGLALIREEAIIFVHDGVRCLICAQTIQECYLMATQKGSAVPAVLSHDSMRWVDGEKNKAINREQVRLIQTPQTFHSGILLPAYQRPYQESFTDEASVVEASGQEIFLSPGDVENIKITRPIDLLIAQNILNTRGAASL